MHASNPETIYFAGSGDWTQARLITVSGWAGTVPMSHRDKPVLCIAVLCQNDASWTAGSQVHWVKEGSSFRETLVWDKSVRLKSRRNLTHCTYVYVFSSTIDYNWIVQNTEYAIYVHHSAHRNVIRLLLTRGKSISAVQMARSSRCCDRLMTTICECLHLSSCMTSSTSHCTYTRAFTQTHTIQYNHTTCIIMTLGDITVRYV